MQVLIFLLCVVLGIALSRPVIACLRAIKPAPKVARTPRPSARIARGFGA